MPPAVPGDCLLPRSVAIPDAKVPGHAIENLLAVGYFGNSGPTVINGPGISNWNIGAEKSFILAGETKGLRFRAELFNAWNHAQFEQPNGNSGAGSNFGRISASRPPRLIQIAAKGFLVDRALRETRAKR